jgi:hypothetical protein
MNFDNLKDAWAQEPVTASIPEPLAGKTSSAITRIRKNMRNEFIATVIGLIIPVLFLGVWRGVHLSVLAICAAAFLLVQTSYYFSRFFLFYRRSARYDLGLRKGLRRFVSELELNMEIYRTYSFCVMPLSCLLWVAILDTYSPIHFIHEYMLSDTPTSSRHLLWLILTLLAAQGIVAFFLQIHLRTQYGGYLRELKKTLEDLEGEV